jgi:hypothetical protein
MPTAGDVRWLGRYVCFEAAVVASVMLVRFAAESKWMREKDWSAYARKKLTYGDVPPQKARQLAKLALSQEFFNGLPAPEYTDEVLQAIGLLISRPEIAAVTPYALDFQLFGRVLGSVPRDYVIPVLGHLQEDALKVGRRILSVLAYAAAIPADMWALENDEMARVTNKRGFQGTLPILDGKRKTDSV